MPRKNPIQIRLKHLQHVLLFQIFLYALRRRRIRSRQAAIDHSTDFSNSSASDDDSDTDSDIQDPYNLPALLPSETIKMAIDEISRLHSTRYLQKRRRIPKSLDWRSRNDEVLTDRMFQMHYRMSRDSFQALLRLIEHHPIFHNNSRCPQKPVELQLRVFLYHLGSNGTGGSKVKVGQYHGIGEGTVYDYVSRVTTAINALQNDYIQWPKPGTTAYENTIEMHHDLHGFPNCIGFVDGTHFPLFCKPSRQHETYYTRKSQYALNGTFIVDAESRILWL